MCVGCVQGDVCVCVRRSVDYVSIEPGLNRRGQSKWFYQSPEDQL